MDLIYLLGLVILVTVISFFIFSLLNDSDVVTFLAERFGRNPASVLKGKVVWLTGASSGIGESLALELAKCGAKVAISARRSEELNRVKNGCLEINPSLREKDILVLPFDMVDLKSHESALQKILHHFGKLDILISNAGGFVRGDWHEIDVALDKELFELNVFSVINMNRLVVKHFLQVGGGQIAVVSSSSGKVPFVLASPYTASKHAIQGYFNALRGETYGKNIDVTLICPGMVQTPLVHGALAPLNGEAAEGKPVPWEIQKMWMSPERCAHLSLVAIANRLNESWVSNLPTIPYMHFTLHFPVISQFIESLIYPAIIRKMKSLL